MSYTDEQLKLLKDCRVETYRSSGAGGQHVNTTDSAVRLTYFPKHIVVTSQKHRSQYANKLECLEKLEEKIRLSKIVQKKRIPTKKTYGSKQRNLKKKKERSETKKLRNKKIDY